MSVTINTEKNSFVIDCPCNHKPNQEYTLLIENLLDLLQNQDKDLQDNNVNYGVISLIKNLIPTDEQAERMFAEPSETLKALNRLKKENFELGQKLRVLTESTQGTRKAKAS